MKNNSFKSGSLPWPIIRWRKANMSNVNSFQTINIPLIATNGIPAQFGQDIFFLPETSIPAIPKKP